MTSRIIFAFAASVLAAAAQAHSFTIESLRIGHPYAHPGVAGQLSAAAYMTIENSGAQADQLIGVAAPGVRSAELHSMRLDNNVMKMREVQEIEIAPGAKVSMKPGDTYHVMLVGLQKPLQLGDRFPLTLTFRKAGKVEVVVVVQDRNKPASEKSGAESAAPAHKH
jgi:copper(I)-binding protein